jgi:hypothetical protein
MKEVNKRRRDDNGSTSWMGTKTKGKAVKTLHEGSKPTQEGWQWGHLMDEDQDRRKGSANVANRR